LLDVFCGAGGCSVGYHRAGFDVVGVDLNTQPRYPFDFVQMDALEAIECALYGGQIGRFVGIDFDAIHASPPCQAYTMLKTLQGDKEYVDLVGATRDLLKASGLPYVIENVVGAPLVDPVMLCGSSFGLRIRRHRLFEANFPIMTPPCQHGWQTDKKYPALNGQDRKRGGRSSIVGVYGNGGDKRADLWAECMEIDWMTRQELTQAIPPAYTELIGHQLMQHLRSAAA
jgi:DNA (cytosine-5)-methyltransferase 1